VLPVVPSPVASLPASCGTVASVPASVDDGASVVLCPSAVEGASFGGPPSPPASAGMSERSKLTRSSHPTVALVMSPSTVTARKARFRSVIPSSSEKSRAKNQKD
jgi:hypothetical protein